MSTSKFADKIGVLQQLRPWEVPVNADVQNHIIALYDAIHGSGGEAFCERESRFLNSMIVDDKAKWNVTSLSVFFAFVDLAVKDLTLEPGSQALCYLLSRSTKLNKVDEKGNIVEAWENRVYIAVTGYGEILLRQRAGQIRHCDTPTVVYDGDDFSYVEKGGRKQVTYCLNLIHDAGNPIACFMKITRLDGSIDYAIILPEAWRRLANYSLKQNERGRRDKENSKANDLYSSGVNGSIDPGFLIAKCAKHAFKNYPKLPIGKGMIMEADLPAEEQMPDYYNLEAAQGPSEDTTKMAEPESFASAADLSAGVTVEPGNDGVTDDGAW